MMKMKTKKESQRAYDRDKQWCAKRLMKLIVKAKHFLGLNIKTLKQNKIEIPDNKDMEILGQEKGGT